MFKVTVEAMGETRSTPKGFIRSYLASTPDGKDKITLFSKDAEKLPAKGDLSVRFSDFGFIAN